MNRLERFMEMFIKTLEWILAVFFGLLALIVLLAGVIQGSAEGIFLGIGTALVSLIACPVSPVYSQLPRWGRLAAIVMLGLLL